MLQVDLTAADLQGDFPDLLRWRVRRDFMSQVLCVSKIIVLTFPMQCSMPVSVFARVVHVPPFSH